MESDKADVNHEIPGSRSLPSTPVIPSSTPLPLSAASCDHILPVNRKESNLSSGESPLNAIAVAPEASQLDVEVTAAPKDETKHDPKAPITVTDLETVPPPNRVSSTSTDCVTSSRVTALRRPFQVTMVAEAKICFNCSEYIQCLNLLHEIMKRPRVIRTFKPSMLLSLQQNASLAQYCLDQNLQRLIHVLRLPYTLEEMLQEHGASTVSIFVHNRALSLSLNSKSLPNSANAIALVKEFIFLDKNKSQSATTLDDPALSLRPATPLTEEFRFNYKLLDSVRPKMVLDLLNVLILVNLEHYGDAVNALRYLDKLYAYCIKQNVAPPESVSGIRLRCLLMLAKTKDANEPNEYTFVASDKNDSEMNADLELLRIEREAYEEKLISLKAEHHHGEWGDPTGGTLSIDYCNWKRELANHRFGLKANRAFLKCLEERKADEVWQMAREVVDLYPQKKAQVCWNFNVPPEVLLNFAMIATSNGYLDIAVEIFVEFTEKYANNPFIWYRLGDCFLVKYLQRGQSQESIHQPNQAFSYKPTSDKHFRATQPATTHNCDFNGDSKQLESPEECQELTFALKCYRIAQDLIERKHKSRCAKTDALPPKPGDENKNEANTEHPANAETLESVLSHAETNGEMAITFFPFAKKIKEDETLHARIEAQVAVSISFCHLNCGDWDSACAALDYILGDDKRSLSEREVSLEVFLLAKMYAAEAHFRLGNHHKAAELLNLQQNLTEYLDSDEEGKAEAEGEESSQTREEMQEKLNEWRCEKPGDGLATMVRELGIQDVARILESKTVYRSTANIENGLDINLALFSSRDMTKGLGHRLAAMPEGEANKGLVHHLALFEHFLNEMTNPRPGRGGSPIDEEAARERALDQLQKTTEEQKAHLRMQLKMKWERAEESTTAPANGKSGNGRRSSNEAENGEELDEEDKEVLNIFKESSDESEINELLSEISLVKKHYLQVPRTSPKSSSKQPGRQQKNDNSGASFGVASGARQQQRSMLHRYIIPRQQEATFALPTAAISKSAIGSGAGQVERSPVLGDPNPKSQSVHQRSSDAVNDLYSPNWAKPSGASLMTHKSSEPLAQSFQQQPQQPKRQSFSDYFTPEDLQQRSRYADLFVRQQHQPKPQQLPGTPGDSFGVASADQTAFQIAPPTGPAEDTTVVNANPYFAHQQEMQLQEQMNRQQQMEEQQKIDQAKMQIAYLSQWARSSSQPKNVEAATMLDASVVHHHQQQQQQFDSSPAPATFGFAHQQSFPGMLDQPTDSLGQPLLNSPNSSVSPFTTQGQGPFPNPMKSPFASPYPSAPNQQSIAFPEQFNFAPNQPGGGSFSQQHSPSNGNNIASSNPNPQMMLSMLSQQLLAPSMTSFLQQQQQQLQQQYPASPWSFDESFAGQQHQQQQQQSAQYFAGPENGPGLVERTSPFFNVPQNQQTAQSQRLQRMNTVSEATLGGNSFAGAFSASRFSPHGGPSPNGAIWHPNGQNYQRSTSVGVISTANHQSVQPNYAMFDSDSLGAFSQDGIHSQSVQSTGTIWGSSSTYGAGPTGEQPISVPRELEALWASGTPLYVDGAQPTSTFHQQQLGRQLVRPPPGISSSALSLRIPSISNSASSLSSMVSFGGVLSPRSSSANRLGSSQRR